MAGNRNPASLDCYVRVEPPRAAETAVLENEVRITAPGKTRNYISYATALLTEKNHTAVALKAMGQAINKTVTIAEIIKRRIPGLHQETELQSLEIKDTWEPLEEGLSSITFTRHVSVVSITLSTLPLDSSKPGYQAPLPLDQVRPLPSPSRPQPSASGADAVPQNPGSADVATGGEPAGKVEGPVTNVIGGGSGSMSRLPQRQLLQVGNSGGTTVYSAPQQPAGGGHGGGRSMPTLSPGSQPVGYCGSAISQGLEPYMVYYGGRMQQQLPVHMMRGPQQMYPGQGQLQLGQYQQAQQLMIQQRQRQQQQHRQQQQQQMQQQAQGGMGWVRGAAPGRVRGRGTLAWQQGPAGNQGPGGHVAGPSAGAGPHFSDYN